MLSGAIYTKLIYTDMTPRGLSMYMKISCVPDLNFLPVMENVSLHFLEMNEIKVAFLNFGTEVI